MFKIHWPYLCCKSMWAKFQHSRGREPNSSEAPSIFLLKSCISVISGYGSTEIASNELQNPIPNRLSTIFLFGRYLNLNQFCQPDMMTETGSADHLKHRNLPVSAWVPRWKVCANTTWLTFEISIDVPQTFF